MRCISSHLTSSLLSFRNPQGAEENWLNGTERVNNYFIFVGKVLITEIGASLLVATASIECAAHIALGLSSLIFMPISSRPCNYFFELFSSSGFTVFWNLGNITVFNLFCINAVTHEAFARYSIDNWPRGAAFKGVCAVVIVALMIMGGRDCHNAGDLFQIPCTRNSDSLYIARWTEARHVRFENVPAANEQMDRIIRHGQQVNKLIDEGADFLKKYIFHSGQLTVASRQFVLGTDPEVYIFAMTRCIYIYAFGQNSKVEIPYFFKAKTRELIEELRKENGAGLEPLMCDHSAFEKGPEDAAKKTVFNGLKAAAYADLQGGLLILQSWKKAMACP